MRRVCRYIAAFALAAAPLCAPAQTAPLKPDGAFRYALGGGGRYASGWAGTLASANVGGEGVIATTDERLRIGARALWSRTVAETASEEATTILLVEESQHRWRGNTWFRQKLSLYPALHAGENAHGLFEAGVAMAMSPSCSLSVGLVQPYESGDGFKAGDPQLNTAISVTLR